MPSFTTIIISLLSVLLLGTGAMHSCSSGRQQRVISGQERQIAELNAERTALARNLHFYEALRSAEDAVLNSAAQAQEQTAAKARYLERRLKEAMRHEKTIDFNTVLDRDVSDAFCLRWLEASGDAAPGGLSAGNAAAGAQHPSAGKRAVPMAGAGESATGGEYGQHGEGANLCNAWQGLTLGEVFEWTGALLDHAGRERLDKIAAREWSRRLRQEFRE